MGLTEAPLLQEATDSGQYVAVPVHLPHLRTTFLEAAFYRRGAPLATVAERRAAVLGWIVSSFKMQAVVGVALGHQRGLSVELYHTNPGESSVLVASVGRAGAGRRLAQSTTLAIDGTWTVGVRGAAVLSSLSADTQAALVFAAGALLSLLLFLLMLALSGSREEALAMVTTKTGELRHQGLHDRLTGLPNRTLALDRTEQLLVRARHSDAPVAALYVDIDALKHVNATYGHAAGDQLLQMIAARLRSVVRESDTVARVAGDEFLVLLDTSTLDATPEMVAERVLEVMREPYDTTPTSGRHVSVTASIGVAYGLPRTAEELLADADLALYGPRRPARIATCCFTRKCRSRPTTGSRSRWIWPRRSRPTKCSSSTSRSSTC